ncbi:unnamed protein product [Dibothriocephalus latus]|uniref:Uncharacterized protein n=1 Tax=Dibothriocephalus latus TaxID=60516 RepID=A0A3P7NHT3_DIBLA|nr:unnamed protein product [Dibothriocephalus latus]
MKSPSPGSYALFALTLLAGPPCAHGLDRMDYDRHYYYHLPNCASAKFQSEARAQESERLVHSLQSEVDARAKAAEGDIQKKQEELSKLEDELVAEKEKYKALSEELESTFAELTGN